ncbi:hypothetical protein ACFSQ0_02495 [Mesonia sediminis]|uniref:Lipocalin-like domain-containing protein n=1 Tax=Mesonia sediminis TaxID=1703946 RepID=A0ABW5SB93_9FLAO
MKLRIKILFSLLLCSLLSCSNDDDNSSKKTNELPKNKISFEIESTKNQKKQGDCFIVVVEDYTYMISAHDGNNMEDQSFSLQFYKSFDQANSENPPVGTYPIKGIPDLAEIDGFWVTYTDLETDLEYNNNLEGQIKITRSDNQILEGSFSFEATNYDTGESIKIINGKFTTEAF